MLACWPSLVFSFLPYSNSPPVQKLLSLQLFIHISYNPTISAMLSPFVHELFGFISHSTTQLSISLRSYPSSHGHSVHYFLSLLWTVPSHIIYNENLPLNQIYHGRFMSSVYTYMNLFHFFACVKFLRIKGNS